MAKIKRLPWPGMGFIRVVGIGKNAVSTYVIRKRIGGQQFEVSTRRMVADAAIVEFRRFENDPHSYAPLPDAPPEAPAGPSPLFLTGELQDDYLRYSARHCGNSPGWYAKKSRYLAAWADALRSVNLRELDMEKHVLPHLKDRAGRPHATAVLKHFISWLRDPENGPKPEQRLVREEGRCVIDYQPRKKTKARQDSQARWFSFESWLAVRAHLSPWMQDAGDVLAATGWHSTELLAFVRKEGEAGRIENPPSGALPYGMGFAVTSSKRAVELAVPVDSKVLVTRHKGGQLHKTMVNIEVAKIAERLQQRGSLDLNRLTNRLAWLCRKKNLAKDHDGPTAPLPNGVQPAVTPGAFRHSVATWLYNARTPLPVISTFLGHMSPATTKKFYATLGVAENPMLVRAHLPAVEEAKAKKVQRSRTNPSR